MASTGRGQAQHTAGRRKTNTAADPSSPPQPMGPVAAAEKATGDASSHFCLPIVGEVHLPSGEELAFIGGVGLLAVVGVLEWPVAILLGVGHALATNRRNRLLREFGSA